MTQGHSGGHLQKSNLLQSQIYLQDKCASHHPLVPKNVFFIIQIAKYGK